MWYRAGSRYFAPLPQPSVGPVATVGAMGRALCSPVAEVLAGCRAHTFAQWWGSHTLAVVLRVVEESPQILSRGTDEQSQIFFRCGAHGGGRGSTHFSCGAHIHLAGCGKMVPGWWLRAEPEEPCWAHVGTTWEQTHPGTHTHKASTSATDSSPQSD